MSDDLWVVLVHRLLRDEDSGENSLISDLKPSSLRSRYRLVMLRYLRVTAIKIVEEEIP